MAAPPSNIGAATCHFRSPVRSPCLAHRIMATAPRTYGIALINSLGNVSGFVAPYVTGWLRDITGTQKTGLWVVGITMVSAAVVALVQRAGTEKV